MREAMFVGFMPSNSAPPPACDSQSKRRRGRLFTGSCHNGQLDLIYYRDPGPKAGKSFPLRMIM
jgi:hypothetical protein